ncbi:serine hydrolase domain-containing protein [Streptomyces sp. NPDC002776]
MAVTQENLEENLKQLAEEYLVPGASAAVLCDGQVTAAATGVLGVRTNVTATTDSLFQIGSITKTFTATALMRLVDRGKVDLDTKVADLLPDLRPQGDGAETLTLRHLLSHTSGLPGDNMLDLGHGEDVLERYAAACSGQTLVHPAGATWSYCNAGYLLLGRIIELLTGSTWDDAMRELLFDPLELSRTVTLPEDALLHRTAIGHLMPQDGPASSVADARPVTRWALPRTLGPAGTVCTTPTELLTLVQLHLAGGVTSSGLRILSEDSVVAMRTPQTQLPSRWGMATHWGLGLSLSNVDGAMVCGHTGNAMGQSAFLQFVPEHGVAIALLANGGSAQRMYRALAGPLLQELAGIQPAAPLTPPSPPLAADLGPHLGVYQNIGMRIEVQQDDAGNAVLASRTIGSLAEVAQQPPQQLPLIAVKPDEGLYLVHQPLFDDYMTVYFYQLATGEKYLHMGLRALPKVA